MERLGESVQPGRGMIDVEFASGSRMRITGAVDPATLTAAVAALASGGGGGAALVGARRPVWVVTPPPKFAQSLLAPRRSGTSRYQPRRPTCNLFLFPR